MTKTVEAGGALTRLYGVVAPTSFQMTPLQVASGFEHLGTYNPAEVRIEATLLNGRLATARVAGFRDENLGLPTTIGDFTTNFSDGGFSLDGRSAPLTTGFFAYRSGIQGLPSTIFSNSRSAFFQLSLADVVDLSSGEAAQYFGGSGLGGLDIAFANGYSGDLTIEPNPGASSYDVPNFSLAMGAESTFWSIRPTSTFDGLVELVFGYDRDLLDVAEDDLAIFHFSSVTGQWEELLSFVDTESRTVRAFTSNFSVFTLGGRDETNFVSTPPALHLVALSLLLMVPLCRRRGTKNPD
jgi:hypothetical protein